MGQYTSNWRAGDQPLIFIYLLFKHGAYRQIDYLFLVNKEECVAYLSQQGIKQAYNLGTKLLKKQYADQLIKRIKKYQKKLKIRKVLKKIPVNDLTGKTKLKIWKEIKKIYIEFGQIYLFCEQPVLAPLEEMAVKILGSAEKLLNVFSDPKLLNKINCTSKEKNILKNYFYLSKEKILLHQYFTPWAEALEKLAKNLATSYKLLPEQMLFMLPPEWEKLMLKGTHPVLKEINQRCRGVVLCQKNGKIITRTGKDYRKWRNKIENSQKNILTGLSVYPGIIRGKAKIHRSWLNSRKDLKGHVLVACNTNPQIVPFLKGVKAIVTDEGGLACHAAIVARELKIPCIVGTKIATKVLKDGDKVEVNADKGIVIKIK